MFDSFSPSSVCFMKVTGSVRSMLRLPSAAWCFIRNSSRRSETDFMREPSERRSSSGRPRVTIVANDNTPTNSITRKSRSKRMLRTPTSVLMLGPSVLEADHLLHHRDAAGHPDAATGEHNVAHALGEEKVDVIRCGKIDERGDHHRQRADNHGRSFRFRRHRLDLALQALAVTEHPGKIAQRFRKIAARLLLDSHDDREETHLGRRHRVVHAL